MAIVLGGRRSPRADRTQALQLLEFLIKNGAEQVIDDARSHLSTIKMLRQFYFIDANGKDQGVNVRNRAKELAELLSDVDRIRQERKKARHTKAKYIGVEGGTGAGGFSGSSMGPGSAGTRFRGFGSGAPPEDEYGGYSGGVYGDGGGFGGRSTAGAFGDEGRSSPRTAAARGASSSGFDEYDEYDDGATAPASARRPAQPRRSEAAAGSAASKAPPKKKAAPPQPEIDLLADDEPAAPPSNGKPLAAAGGDDDFDDFQSAAPARPAAAPHNPPLSTPASPPLTSSASSLSLVQPKPVSTTQRSGMESLVGLSSPPISAGSSAFGTPAISPANTGPSAGMGMAMGGLGAPMKPSNVGYQPAQPNYFTSVPLSANTGTKSSPLTAPAQQPKKTGSDAFGNIWNQASSGIKKVSTTPTPKSASLQTMAQEKASAGIWGTGAAKPAASPNAFGTTSTAAKTGGAMDDLLG